MNSNLKRLLLIFVTATVITITLFYFVEEDRNCVFEWGTKCSNSFLLRSGFQVVILTVLLFFFSGKKKIDKQ